MKPSRIRKQERRVEKLRELCLAAKGQRQYHRLRVSLQKASEDLYRYRVQSMA